MVARLFFLILCFCEHGDYTHEKEDAVEKYKFIDTPVKIAVVEELTTPEIDGLIKGFCVFFRFEKSPDEQRLVADEKYTEHDKVDEVYNHEGILWVDTFELHDRSSHVEDRVYGDEINDQDNYDQAKQYEQGLRG